MEKKCPIVKEACWEHKCTFFRHILGKDPQTGKEYDEWDCVIVWQPMLQIENANEARKTAATVQAFRNDIISIVDYLMKITSGLPLPSLQEYLQVAHDKLMKTLSGSSETPHA